MVTYSYNIDESLTIQHAIDTIVSELDTGDPVTEDIIVNVTDGEYAGFTIPDGGLMPLMGTTHRLIIRSAGPYFPVINFNKSAETQIVGADIGSANPNVTIEGLRFQYFAVGIRANLNSHNPKINKCIVSDNRNVGILVEQCDNTQVVQCVVTNGDYGIVARLCKNIALIHNTVFLNGSLSTEEGKAVSAIWCQLNRDYEDINRPKGILHLIGNVAWNLVGSTLSLFNEDVEDNQNIISNYNNFVVGDRSKFISIEDDSTYYGENSRARAYLTSLQDWKNMGYDEDSISEDPKFVVPTKVSQGRNKYAIDLNLLPLSPCLGLVPSFHVNAAATATWLPSYVSSSDLQKDILGNNRQQNNTAAGANDKETNSGFFGQDILISPLSSSGDESCTVNPIIDLIVKRLDLWYPKYKVGYFYSYDREYYLYSKKECKYLGELARTSFILPSRITTEEALNSLKLKVSGIEITDTSYYDVIGHEFRLYHKNLSIISGDEEVEIEYDAPVWKDGSYSTTRTVVLFKINEGTTRYFLPSTYIARGPVVLTDDTAYPTNKDVILNREFNVIWDKEEQKAEIILSNDNNLVKNPQFQCYVNGPPIQWESVNSSIEIPASGILPVGGPYVCHISGGGYISQTLPTHTGESCLSFYAISRSGAASVGYEVEYFDNFNRDLGYKLSGYQSLGNDWTRYYVNFGATGSTILPNIDTDYPTNFIRHINVPDTAGKMSIKFYHHSGSSVYVDSVQYENTTTPSFFTRKPFGNEITVEYESSSDEYFTDTNQVLSASISPMTEGFLYIPEIPASAFDGPPDLNVTTLNDWKWPDGRKRVMPWARTEGKDKYRRRAVFNTYPEKKYDIAAPVLFTPSIKDINIVPSVPMSLQGDELGSSVVVSLTDSNNNPFVNARISAEIIDYNQKFPGYLHKKLYGMKEQLGPAVFGRTDSAGNFHIMWVPPLKEDSIIYADIPTPVSTAENGNTISYINTKYPINLDYHGNVLVFDQEGNQILTKATSPSSGYYNTNYAGSYSVIRLTYPITYGSAVVIVDNKVLTETQSASPDSDQYYVDYENSTITVGQRKPRVYIEYIPSYVFINQADPFKIVFFHDLVFGSRTGKITIGYDYTIKLNIKATDYSTQSVVQKSFDLLAVNALSAAKNSINKNYLDL